MLVLYGFYESSKRWKCSGEENDYKMPDWEKKEEETNCGVSRIHIYRIPILFHSHIQLYPLSLQGRSTTSVILIPRKALSILKILR